jgi:glutamyl-tRNA synthetase
MPEGIGRPSDARPVVVRFAPSPTGHLHVGNIRTALFNWLFARGRGGRFLLRLDDTDEARSKPEYAESIADDLGWLGLDHDAVARQSDRYEAYAAAVEQLKQAGRLYACYETPEELSLRRRTQRTRGLPPVYDRAALHLTEAEKRAQEAAGRAPYWRLLLDREVVAWTDLVQGESHIDAASLSDPVLVRADGRPLYTLSSVVDDAEFGISHVIRGADHVANTAVQIQLFRALGAAAPAFAHHSLMVGPGGEELSKRAGALSLRETRAEGIEPMAVLSLLARLGTSDPVEPFADIAPLVAGFDLGKLGRAPVHFDPAELRALNARLLGTLPHAAVAERLRALGVGGGAAFWDAVRPNLHTLDEARDWWRVVEGPVAPTVEEADAELVAQAAALLPAEPWDDATWPAWTKAVQAATGHKGRALFRPLRLALTGREHGPELKSLLPLIGRDRAQARLRGQRA